MTITEIIQKRRATPPGLFSKTAIDKTVINQLLENASWAPNHKKTEPWRFVIYSNESKSKLAETCGQILIKAQSEGFTVTSEKIEKFVATLQRVPVVIATIMQLDPGQRLPEWEEVAAVSMAVQNMWLTATEMGLGAFWATPDFMNLFNEVLEIQHGQKLLGFFYVGEIMMDYPSPGRGDLGQKVSWK